MTVLFASIFPLCIFCATAAPQLKIGNSGYEIISISDQSAEDSIPLASKLTTSSASRFNGIGALNLEKATDADDEEAPIFFPQPPKRHYEFPHLSLNQKSVIESQPSAIDVTKKRLSKPKIGTAKNVARPSSPEKEARAVIPISEKTGRKYSSLDDSNSQEESGREKSVPKYNRAKIDAGEAKSIGKSAKSIDNSSEKIEGDGGKFESENFEVAELRDEYKIVSVPTFDLLDDKSLGFRDLALRNQEKFVAPGFVEPGFTLVTHFPSTRIHRQKSSLVGHKKPAMFSPIYPSGFETPTESSREKSAAVKELRGNQFWVNRKNARSKKIVRPGLEDENRFLLGQEFNEILTGREPAKFYEGSKSSQNKIPSALALSKMSHETLEPKNFPMSLGSLNHQPPHFPNQQPLNKMTHFKVVSVPLVATFQNSLPTSDSSILNSQDRWEKTIPVGSIDFTKRHQRGNDFDREFLDFNRISTGRRLEPTSEIPTSSAHESSRDLVIDIVRGEVAPDDSPDALPADTKREDAEGHEMRDASQAQVPASAKSSCRQPKPPTPAFYEFLAKFTNILLGKSLQYEATAQARDDGQEFLDDVYASVA